MSKVGISLKIDVSKIDKSHMFKGEKGTYLDATVFVDLDNADQYGNHGMITQSWKDQVKGEGAILGNAKIFWRDQGQQQPNQQPQPQPQHQEPDFDNLDDDIPF